MAAIGDELRRCLLTKCTHNLLDAVGMLRLDQMRVVGLHGAGVYSVSIAGCLDRESLGDGMCLQALKRRRWANQVGFGSIPKLGIVRSTRNGNPRGDFRGGAMSSNVGSANEPRP